MTYELYIHTLSVTDITSSLERTACRKYGTPKLLDDDPQTCISVQEVLYLTIASTEPLHQLMILTRDIDCAQRFHVSVYVKRPTNQCNKVDVAQLTSFSYVNGTEHNECVYAIPQGDGDIVIRLAAVHKGRLCFVTQN